ncbi:response regulator [Chitinimonas arctica]|uniref:Response regulator n=1 Tax=Chitinimonas arctica TaxID=2594795 RepID=A0A516S9S0_9NEIS|nr:response regulator [Chitinimonas arctica]QDQ24893.1 response regulator [Chitinimonas arctica]
MERTLLLVDDEANIIAALTRLFRREGYTILTADSGESGLLILSKHPVGVIISDQRMLHMKGTEFLSAAKLLQPNCVRIVLSGYTEVNSITDAVNRGSVFRFLTKPWDDQTLLEQVDEAFEQYELKMTNFRLSEELQQKNVALEKTKHQLEIALANVSTERDVGRSILKITQQVLHQAPVAIIGYTLDGTIAVNNQQASRLFPALCPGLDIYSLLPYEVVMALKSNKTAGTYRESENRQFNFKNTPLNANNAVAGMILTFIPQASDRLEYENGGKSASHGRPANPL